MPDDELHDLSEHDLPEVGPGEKEVQDDVVVFQLPGGGFAWSRREGVSGDLLDGSGQACESEADAVDQASRLYPDLTISHTVEG